MFDRLEMTMKACIVAYEELMKLIFEVKPSWSLVSWSNKTKARFDSNKLKKTIEKMITNNDVSTENLFDDDRERSCKV